MADRDSSGRFVKGYQGGPGRKPRRTEDQYLKATVDSITLADWKEIVEKAAAQAKRGDSRARQWLSDYLLGKPQQKIDVTSADQPLVIQLSWGDAGATEDS